MEKVFIIYIDENNEQKKGHFELVEETMNYIKVRSKKNEIIIPYHRIIKTKKEVIKK